MIEDRQIAGLGAHRRLRTLLHVHSRWGRSPAGECTAILDVLQAHVCLRSACGGALGELGGEAVEDGGPVVDRGLAEEAGVGVPRGLVGGGAPAPVGVAPEEGPGGAGHGAGEMGDGGVDGDEEIELGQEGGGVGEIEKMPGEIDEAGLREGGWAEGGELEAVEGGPFDPEEREEHGGRAEPIAPDGPERGIGSEVWLRHGQRVEDLQCQGEA